MNIRRKLTFLIITLFLISIINTVFVFILQNQSSKKTYLIEHTNKVLTTSKSLLMNLINAETGQRGFLLTNTPTYLQPYHTGISKAFNNYNQLISLMPDNTLHKEELLLIKKYMNLKSAELNTTILLLKSGKKHEALNIINSGDGKCLMDELRKKINKLINIELNILEQRKSEFELVNTQIKTLVYIEEMFFIVIVLTIFAVLRNNLFKPMATLLAGTKKIERGEKVAYEDIIPDDEMSHLLSTFFKMSEKIYHRELKLGYEANHDNLTGIKNRTTLFQDIDKTIIKAKNGCYNIGIIYFDLDQFKTVNDTYGHHVGDIILKVTSERINNIIRESDCIYRIGGDEFLILLSDVKTITDMKDIAEKMLSVMTKPIQCDGKTLTVSISIGIAIFPRDSQDSATLVKYADIAMYSAKKDPDNAYYVFDNKMLMRQSDYL